MDFTRKGKATEGKGLTGYPLAKRFSLASPSMLLPSKPLPPIRKSSLSTMPSKILSRELEIGKNVTSYDEDSRKTQEQSSERKGRKVFLTPICRSVGVVKKRSLLPPLIPPIGKAGSAARGSEYKVKAEHGSASHRDLTECGDPKNFFLDTPYAPLRAKLLPPIQKSSLSSEPSKMCKKKQQECRKNLTVSDDSCGNKKELIPAGKGCKVSLMPACSSAGVMKKWSLGLPVIPPIPKANHPALGREVKAEPCSASHRDLTGHNLSKKFSLDPSYVPLPTKYLPPIPKSFLSSHLRKKLPPVQRVFKE